MSVYSFSYYLGLYMQTKFTYVTSFQRSAGLLDILMKMVVFVPSTRPGIPCASLPNLFLHERSHVSLVLGSSMRGLYSMTLPSSPITTFAISTIQLTPVLARWSLVGILFAIIATLTDRLLTSNTVFALALAHVLYPGCGAMFSSLSSS